MSDSIETSEDMAMPFNGELPGTDGQVDPITRAVQLLREVAEEYARSVSIGDVPDWANEPETKAAHDEALLIARHLEAMAQDKIDEQWKVGPLTDELVPILGRPNFTCIRYAEMLRELGQAIPHKAEFEQAAVIHWMLGFYATHGEKWAEAAVESMEAMRAARTRGEALASKPQDEQVPHA